MPRRKKSEGEIVLVVDDDPLVRESLSELLDHKGYSVLQAENGRKALDLLKEVPRTPFVVLLDLAMPVLDGHEFLKQRAGDPHLRRIPVVVVSANPRPSSPLEGIEAYLQKPLEPDVLLEIIRRTHDEKLGTLSSV